MKRGYMDGPYGQIHFRRFGAGQPTLLLHQSPLSSAQFDAAAPYLGTAGLDCVALDLPSMGMSDPVEAGTSLDDFVAIIPVALDHLGWAHAHIVGHHTGAALAARFGARNPDAVGRLILNGVPLLSAEEVAFFATLKLERPQMFADGGHLRAAWDRRVTATPGWHDLAAMHRWTIEGLARHDTSWMAFPAVIGHDLTPDLLALTMPTLLFTNTGEDLYAATRRAQKLAPHFAYAELKGGTHNIIDEQPEAWARIVTTFLTATETPK
jgi:pimeloyl-ACP methyl ester carboxylesterase